MTTWADGWAPPRTIGDDLLVPVLGGGAVRYANLDHAASTPALQEVWGAIGGFLPWYSSVHRGAGLKSRVATAVYEESRQTVAEFFGARQDDVVVFTRNTTDAVNLLAHCLPPGTTVVRTSAEHHANLLPWRGVGGLEVPVPSSPAELLEGLATILRARPPKEEVLLAVTGASNVTGEVWPLAAIASLAHNYGARVFVDAAQLAPHRPVDIAGLGLDWVAFSGHKLYAPFGCGALIGRRDWLQAADPYLLGGGAVAEVTESGSVWASGPSRHEGGSPNLLGALAIAAACRALSVLGRDRAASHDRLQSERLQAVLDGVPGVDTYAIWPENEDRLPVRTFQVRGYRPAEVAAVLSAEHGIGVRYGSFCAHPLLAHLERSQPAASGCSGAVPGAVRASLGLTSAVEELDRLSTALRQLVREGPRGKYRTLPDGSVEPAWGDRPYADFFSSARSGPSALQHLHTRL